MAPNQGSQSGPYGLDNLTYDLITVLHEKSKGLEAFDQYPLPFGRGAGIAFRL